jgi:phage-related protein (TIGR01555 family)
VIKVPDLTDILSTDDATNKLVDRFSRANAAKSVINTILLDEGEDWQRVQASLLGVPEVLNTYLQLASGAADIPSTRFLGRSPAGLNATGDSDTRNYYDRLSSDQSTTLTPAMNVLDEVIIRSALGDRPEEIFYNWRSLWQLSDDEKAKVSYQKAQTFKIDVDAAVIPTNALAHARVNQLIEDGTYPGLEQAMADAEADGDTIEEFNKPDPMQVMLAGPGQTPLDPKTGQPLAKPTPALPAPGKPKKPPFA